MFALWVMVLENQTLFLFKSQLYICRLKNREAVWHKTGIIKLHQRYADAVYNFNKRLEVERSRPAYPNFYEHTKLTNKMHALEFLCERTSPLY